MTDHIELHHIERRIKELEDNRLKIEIRLDELRKLQKELTEGVKR